LGFVFGEFFVAERWLRGVKSGNEMSRFLLVDDVENRVRHAENGGRADFAGGEARCANQREVGSIHERHSVEKEQPFFCGQQGHGRMLTDKP